MTEQDNRLAWAYDAAIPVISPVDTASPALG